MAEDPIPIPPPHTSLSLATRPVQGLFFLLGGGGSGSSYAALPNKLLSSHAPKRNTKKKEKRRNANKIGRISSCCAKPGVYSWWSAS